MSQLTLMQPCQTQERGSDSTFVQQAFRQAFRRHPAGVAILTAQTDDQPVALTISSLISVSVSPALVAFSLSAASRSAASLLAAESFLIHFVTPADQELAARCASSGVDRFGTAALWEPLPTGEPCFTQVETWFRACVHKTLELESATVVTAQILEAQVMPENAAADRHLVYCNRQWHTLDGTQKADCGNTPRQAPLGAASGAWQFWP